MMSRGIIPSGPDDATPPLPSIIGSCPAMREVYYRTRKVAPTKASVLLLGETGTGKELVAEAIHRLSGRREGPFIKVNCGALSENLLESELFGHVRGAFTGAVSNRTGRFEAAHTGTIFLDEINSTSLQLQVKLLRVLQEQEFERVGDTATVRTDVRVVAASNRELLEQVEKGMFREDLYYRLNVVPIVLPPLRARREDIPELVQHFLNLYNEENDTYVVHIERKAMEAMQNYHWPGNIRELQNYIQRAVVMAPGDEITYELLQDSVLNKSPGGSLRRSGNDLDTLAYDLVESAITQDPTTDSDLSHVVKRVERELIAQVMAACDNVQVKAASRLGMNRNTLHKKLKEYGLDGDGH